MQVSGHTSPTVDQAEPGRPMDAPGYEITSPALSSKYAGPMKPAVGHTKWLVAALAIRRSHCHATPGYLTSQRKLGLTVNSALTKRSYAAAGTAPGSGGPSGSTKSRPASWLGPPCPSPCVCFAGGLALWSLAETRYLR